MADFDFTCLPNIPDDTAFVYRAMNALGFLVPFHELTTDQMRLTLAFSQYLKRHDEPEVWES